MPLRSQKQVMVQLDRMNGRTLRRAKDAYVRHTLGPLVAAIRDSAHAEHALGKLGAAMLRQMDSADMERIVADAGVQSGLIGRASALPKAESKKQKAETGE